MDTLILEKVKELLAKNASIGIAVGKNPGVDEIGSALSLYLALAGVGKKITVVCPTEPIVEVSSLVGIDKVKKSFEGDSLGDLTVSFPYKEGEIEKISYTLEDGKLNILVKAGEQGLSFNEKSIDYKRSGGAPGLVFVIGTPRLSDLGTAFDMEALKDSKVINIDYKTENQGFGDIPLISKNSSSVSELVASLLSSLGLNIDVDIASNLLSGIIRATENFQSANTGSLSFEMAALLLKKGGVRPANHLKKKQSILAEDSFFTPKLDLANATSNVANAKAQPKTPYFSKTPTFANASADKTIGTGEKKPEVKLNGDNPPDDWLSPKIYRGSTSI